MSGPSRQTRPGRPNAHTEALTVRMPTAFMERLDDWRSTKRPIPSRPETVRIFAALGFEMQPLVPVLLKYINSVIEDADEKQQLEKLLQALNGFSE